MSLFNYTFTKPYGGTYTGIFDFEPSCYDTFWQKVHQYDYVWKFILSQDVNTVLIVFSAFMATFGMTYFYRLYRRQFQKTIFWESRALYWKNFAVESNKENINLMNKRYVLNKRVRELEMQLRVTKQELEATNSTTIDREQLADDLVRIISILPVKDSSDTIRAIANLAQKFDIQITVDTPKPRKRSRTDTTQVRKNPKRKARKETEYIFSEDESEDNKRNDPDYSDH